VRTARGGRKIPERRSSFRHVSIGAAHFGGIPCRHWSHLVLNEPIHLFVAEIINQPHEIFISAFFVSSFVVIQVFSVHFSESESGVLGESWGNDVMIVSGERGISV
jgi:hypothetical protein